MVSFEQPWGGLALLLFLPFLLWLRHRRPVRREVGGLEPFLGWEVRGRMAADRRPPAFWFLSAAYLVASLALMLPQGPVASRLLLEDRSPSMERWRGQAPNGFQEVRVLGGEGQVVTHLEILGALSQVAPGRPVTVWTDQDPPAGLPHHVTWTGPDASGVESRRGALFQAFPVDSRSWRVHWGLREGVEAVLQVGDWSSPVLQGRGGTVEVPVQGLPAEIRLVETGTTAEVPGLAVLPLEACRFLLAEGVHTEWEAALLALWPAAEVVPAQTRSEEGRPGTPGVRVQYGGSPAPDILEAWTSMAWSFPPTAEGIGRLASGWRTWIQERQPSRDRRESLPETESWTYAHAWSGSVATSQGLPHGLPWWVAFGGLLAAMGWWHLPRPVEER